MRWLSHVGLVIALAVVIARFTTTDSLRDPWEIAPGSPAVPGTPGPGTGLVFDLLACLPAILALTRGTIDREFRLAWRSSHLLLFLLAGWAVLSTGWSVDRFAAAVTSAHFFAAAALLWAMSQLVREPGQFRVVSALAFGMLLVLTVQSALYRFMDVPENIAYWQQNKTEILKEHNWEADSFAARQFEHKLTSGELVGFFNSANTLAAAGVLLFFSCAGIGLQKLYDGEPRKWLALPAAATLALVWILLCARSKTSAATPFLGAGIIGLFYLFHRRVTPQNFTRYFWLTSGGVAVLILAVAGHGWYHRGLFPGHFSNSLDFRWKYWVASAAIFISHPAIGIGWSNFGDYYLAHRLPEAAEEIKDPHNFLVRIFVELGIVGGFLCIGWLLRTAWEITRPQAPSHFQPNYQTESKDPLSIRVIPMIVILGMVFSIIASTDFSLSVGDLITLLLKPLLYLLALLLGTMSAAMLSQHSWSLDSRRAPLIFAGTITGLALFLIHNLIDFSIFEVGPMFLFMALLGSSQGIRSSDDQPPIPRPLTTAAAALASVALWFSAAAFFVAPILLAEQSATEASELIRTAPISQESDAYSHFHQAANALAAAARLVPYNSDYPFRQAELCLRMNDIPQAQSLITQARQINPRLIDSYLLDANLQLSLPAPNLQLVQTDFDQILQLNPNDVSLHLQYAKALEHLGLTNQARVQYSQALKANAALPPDEPKRLPPDQVAQVQAKL
jgi:hypothetical protein